MAQTIRIIRNRISDIKIGDTIIVNKSFPNYADLPTKVGIVKRLGNIGAMVKFKGANGNYEVHDREFELAVQKPMKKYLVRSQDYERFGEGTINMEIHKATDLASLLEKVYSDKIEEFKEDFEDEGKVWKGLTPKLIKEMESRNGDGDDLFEIYEITPKDKLKCVYGGY